MVKSQARIFVPGSNLSKFDHARSKASCTRSSATEADPLSEIAKARRLPISATSWSLKLAGGIGASLRRGFIGGVEARNELVEPVRQRRFDEVVIMGLERPADRLHRLGVDPGVGRRPVVCGFR